MGGFIVIQLALGYGKQGGFLNGANFQLAYFTISKCFSCLRIKGFKWGNLKTKIWGMEVIIETTQSRPKHSLFDSSILWHIKDVETFQLTSQFLYSLGSRWCNEDSGLVKLWWIMERTPLLMFKMYSGSSSLQKIWPTFPSLYSNLSGRSSNGFSSLETGETVCDSDWSKDVTFTSYRIGFLIYKEKKNLNNLI